VAQLVQVLHERHVLRIRCAELRANRRCNRHIRCLPMGGRAPALPTCGGLAGPLMRTKPSLRNVLGVLYIAAVSTSPDSRRISEGG
jgi:hypothetical protein